MFDYSTSHLLFLQNETPRTSLRGRRKHIATKNSISATTIFIQIVVSRFIIISLQTIMFYFYVPQQNYQPNHNASTASLSEVHNPFTQLQTLSKTLNICSRIDSLTSEVRALRNRCENQFKQTRQGFDLLAQQLSCIKRVYETQKPKKTFKKSIECTIDDCGRKYSSKIALNCHIRHKHPDSKRTSS